MKLKYVLPLAQMALAVGVFQWFDVPFGDAMHLMELPRPPLMLLVLQSINAPVALARALIWGPYLWGLADTVLWIAATSLLWYWIGINVERRTFVVFQFPLLRITTDLLLVAMGACLGWIFFSDPDRAVHPNSAFFSDALAVVASDWNLLFRLVYRVGLRRRP